MSSVHHISGFIVEPLEARLYVERARVAPDHDFIPAGQHVLLRPAGEAIHDGVPQRHVDVPALEELLVRVDDPTAFNFLSVVSGRHVTKPLLAFELSAQ